MWNTRVTKHLAAFVKQDSGQDLVEYGLLVSLIATFLVGAVTNIGQELSGLWDLVAAIRYTNP